MRRGRLWVGLAAVLGAMGWSSRLLGQVTAPTVTEIGEAFTDELYPALPTLIGIAAGLLLLSLAIIVVRRKVWRTGKSI